MKASEIVIGQTYRHAVHGNCVVVYGNSRGFWIQVWGGISGDKLYTFKGVKPEELSPRNAEKK